MTNRGGTEGGSAAGLRVAVAAWVESGRGDALGRWLERELDGEGTPRREPVGDWGGILRLLAEARRARPGAWPEGFDERLEGLFRGVLRFSRPDGSPVFEPRGSARAGRRGLFRTWAEWLGDPGLATVIAWYFPARGVRPRHAPPPLPAWAATGRPLAVLRAGWTRPGELVAVDHRAPGPATAVELMGQGIPWLGPTWTTSLEATGIGPATRPRWAYWASGPSADVAEWTFRLGGARVVRTAVLLRGRALAVLADQVEGRPPLRPALRLARAEGIEARPLDDCRGLALARAGRRAEARVWPVGLPCLPYPTERGSFTSEGGELVLRQRHDARRSWLPLVVSWDPARNRAPVSWRSLTVSERSRVCPPGVACAARISWGLDRDDTLLIYRSLARPALRAVLGHQTRARFLLARFDRHGDVTPLLTIDPA